MRTNIDIDDELLSQAMTAAGRSTKRATVEDGLRLLVRLHRQTQELANLKGLGWEGDFDTMRDDTMRDDTMRLDKMHRPRRPRRP